MKLWPSLMLTFMLWLPAPVVIESPLGTSFPFKALKARTPEMGFDLTANFPSLDFAFYKL
jgi:hypothetical protein